MKGKVLDFSMQKNHGVISAEDGKRYRFQASDWMAKDLPQQGLFVDFEPNEGIAQDIYMDIDKNATACAHALQGAIKSRTVFIVLAIFLGNFGVHNFYAGYIGRAIAQVLITVITGWLIFPLLMVWLWAVIEACTVTEDANDIPFN